MDRITAEILCGITSSFYTAQAQSFSATRQAPWQGWSRILYEVGLPVSPLSAATETAVVHEPVTVSLEQGLFRNTAVPYTVLDVGAGNLRFLRFLREQLPAEVQLDLYAVDNCEAMLPDEERLANDLPFVRFQKIDILQRLLHESNLVEQIEAPPCSLVVCFGLMHHVPGVFLRKNLLDTLISLAAPGGYIAVSFWQFLNSLELASRAEDVHPRALDALGINPACLDAGDYLLGWQDLPPQEGTVRYCHNFTESEVAELLQLVAPRVKIVAEFDADGRTGNLNRYLVLQRVEV